MCEGNKNIQSGKSPGTDKIFCNNIKQYKILSHIVMRTKICLFHKDRVLFLKIDTRLLKNWRPIIKCG